MANEPNWAKLRKTVTETKEGTDQERRDALAILKRAEEAWKRNNPTK